MMPLKPGKKSAIKLSVNKLEKLDAISERVKKIDLVIRQSKFANSISTSLKLAVDKLITEIKKENAKLDSDLKLARKEADVESSTNITQIAALITKDASKALTVYKSVNMVLYHSNYDDTPPVYVGRSHEKRNPSNNSESDQILYDIALTKMGIKAQRHNSIFATSTYSIANERGDDVYIVFPKNSANISFSDNKEFRNLNNYHIVNHDLLHKLNDWLYKKYDYDAESPEDFIEEGEFPKLKRYLIKVKYPGADKLTLSHFVDANRVKKKYHPTDKGFTLAVKNGKEVLINGEYIAVSSRFAKGLFAELGINAKVPK